MRGNRSREFVLGSFLVAWSMTATAGDIRQAPSPGPAAKLHIKTMTIAGPECGKPLDFRIEIGNSGGAFRKTAWLIVTSSEVPGVRVAHSFSNIAANSTDKEQVVAPQFPGDCCRERHYSVEMRANENGSGSVPEGDGMVFLIIVKPACELRSVGLPSPAVARSAGSGFPPAKTPVPARLHIQGLSIVGPACGKPLSFAFEILNSGGPFSRTSLLEIKGAGQTFGRSFDSIAGNSTYSDSVGPVPSVTGDCCKEQCFDASLRRPPEQGGGNVPEWDGQVFRVCARPLCKLIVTP